MSLSALPAERMSRRLVDAAAGHHRWGTVQTWIDRRGTTTHRLSVYPPGLPADRRLRLRVWRAWPALGFALLPPTLLVSHLLGAAGPVVAAVAAGYVLGGLAARRAASPERTRLREFWAEVPAGSPVRSGAALVARLDGYVETLCLAESGIARGRLDEAGLLRIWAEVYAELDDGATAESARRAWPPRR